MNYKQFFTAWILGLVFAPIVYAETPIAPAKASELPVPLEEWASKSKVYTGSLCEELCLCIQPDAVVKSIDKKVWMDQVGRFKGILVLHPYSQKNPGLILYPLSQADGGKTLIFKARSSDFQPGGKIVFKSGEKILGEAQIDNEWVELSVPIPIGAKEIRMEWNAIGWDWEVLWVDEISVI